MSTITLKMSNIIQKEEKKLTRASVCDLVCLIACEKQNREKERTSLMLFIHLFFYSKGSNLAHVKRKKY